MLPRSHGEERKQQWFGTVQGERVGGKDHHVSIMVEPNCIELNASDLSGGGLEQCQAGEQAEVLLTPRDALGNPNASFSMGGENQGQLSVRVMVEDSDAEQTTALMTPDVAKSGRLKVCLLSHSHMILQFNFSCR